MDNSNTEPSLKGPNPVGVDMADAFEAFGGSDISGGSGVSDALPGTLLEAILGDAILVDDGNNGDVADVFVVVGVVGSPPDGPAGGPPGEPPPPPEAEHWLVDRQTEPIGQHPMLFVHG